MDIFDADIDDQPASHEKPRSAVSIACGCRSVDIRCSPWDKPFPSRRPDYAEKISIRSEDCAPGDAHDAGTLLRIGSESRKLLRAQLEIVRKGAVVTLAMPFEIVRIADRRRLLREGLKEERVSLTQMGTMPDDLDTPC